MAVIAKLCCVLVIAGLAGCAQNAGLPGLGLLPSGEAATADATEAAGGHPPLPVRNTERRAQGAGGERESGTAGLLASLPNVELLTASTYAPDRTQWDDQPVAVYTRLAKKIRGCWLSPTAPKLENHAFHAEVGTSDAKTAKIIIYKKANDGQRGLQAFRIQIDSELTGSIVKAENRRLDKDLEQTFKADLARWSKGDASCRS